MTDRLEEGLKDLKEVRKDLVENGRPKEPAKALEVGRAFFKTNKRAIEKEADKMHDNVRKIFDTFVKKKYPDIIDDTKVHGWNEALLKLTRHVQTLYFRD